MANVLDVEQERVVANGKFKRRHPIHLANNSATTLRSFAPFSPLPTYLGPPPDSLPLPLALCAVERPFIVFVFRHFQLRNL
jgi:hypothetical protein